MAQDHDADELMPVVGLACKPPPRWQIDRSGARSWRAWDDEVVVYNQRTATTHQLGPAASAVFLTLADSDPVTEQDILSRMDAREERARPATADEMKHLRDILDSLQSLGLAESRAS